MLAAEGEHEPDCGPSTGAGREPGADGIQPGVRLACTGGSVADDCQ